MVQLSANVIDEIIQAKDTLPKKQQKLCNYLIMNSEKVGVMTVAQLAENAGVGTTTVMRLVQTLGRVSFMELRKELLDAALMRTATSYRQLKQNFKNSIGADSGALLHSTANDGIAALENLCTPSNIEQFGKILDLLEGAQRIFLLGLRSSMPLAVYCEDVLCAFYPHVHQLSYNPEYIFDRIALYTKPEDVMLIFSAWPCTRKSVEAAELCNQMGVPVCVITNSSLNPIIRYAQAAVDTNSANRLSGHTAMMAVIEALAAELGRRNNPSSSENLETVEQILKEKDLVLTEYE